METYLKRYFWVLHLVLILAAAGFFAVAASNVLDGLISPFAVLSPPPPQKVAKSNASKVGASNLAATDKERWGKPAPEDPNKPEDENKPDEAVAEEEPEVQPEGEYPVSDLPVSLSGTMVASNSRWSRALLIDNSSRASFSAVEGEAILEEGAKLVKIERDRVVVEREGRLEQIELENPNAGKGGKRGGASKRNTFSRAPKTPALSKTTPKPAAKSAASGGKNDKFSDLRKGIRKLNDNKFEVDRKTIQEVLTNPGKYRDGTRPIPNYKGGKINGFKLVGMKPGSIYYDLGLRPGDVITSINGKPLNGPNAALELVQNIGTISNVRLGIDRNGTQREVSANIK